MRRQKIEALSIEVAVYSVQCLQKLYVITSSSFQALCGLVYLFPFNKWVALGFSPLLMSFLG